MSAPDPASPGSDGLTRSEMYRWLETYDQKWAEGHERLRNALDRNTAEMRDGFNGIHADLEKRADEEHRLNLRVHDIEVSRTQEAATVTRRNLLGSGVVATVVGTVTAWLFKKFFG